MQNKTLPLSKLLLIENSSTDAKFVSLALEEIGLDEHLQWIANEKEVFAYLDGCKKNQLPQVVLLDMDLETVSGIEVLEKIRSHPYTKYVPVVMFSSSPQDKHIRTSLTKGANSYIVKPLDIYDFFEVIHHTVKYWLEVNRVVPLEEAAKDE